jgi:hypothetical protein
MPEYVMNKNAQSNGDHEVHVITCNRLPIPEHRLSLGYHTHCSTAVAQAKKINPKADGCAYCSPACNRS